ncbi:MAG: AIR synthase-related protein [Patescibacteria group bacterium]
MANRIEIIFKSELQDTRALVWQKKIQRDFPNIQEVFLVDVFTIDKDFSVLELDKIADSLTNLVIQEFKVNHPNINQEFSFAVEIGYLPGVTDNCGATAKEIIEDLFKIEFSENEDVYSSQIFYLQGHVSMETVKVISQSFYNDLIQRCHIKSYQAYQENKGMNVVIPKVKLEQNIQIDKINLDISDNELIELGKKGIKNLDGTYRGPLALDLQSLKNIKAYFDKLSRRPTDAELEALAQTWSEHCKHTIFAAEIDDIKDGLYKHYIKRATADIRRAKGSEDFCVSVFKDNSGGIIFDDNWIITDKVETHNSPSALDPFGGAITGIVGVNRDTIGFGQGAKPFLNKYGYCFANPDDNQPIYKDIERKMQMLSPRRILDGVVAGVNAGGNCSGIPTPQGFVYFNDRYKGKPLIFVGTLGLIPRVVNGKHGWDKQACSGDAIVMVGGKVGADGIHGATFSSETLSSGSPATAVQIGDPYTQKKLSDVIVKEARDMGLYSAITDNGAGGLSSSIGEMAEQSGGCEVNLEQVPLKYPGLQPWQIWISESQERMSLAVPQNNLDKFMALMQRRGVNAWVIGKFTNSGKCVVKFEEQSVIDIDLDFMHNGNPKYSLQTDWQKSRDQEMDLPLEIEHIELFFDTLSSLNNASFDFISYQYDYEVLGGSCVKPLQGIGQVNGTASVSRPLLESKKGVVCSQALYPAYSELNPYKMSACAIDTAIRNCIAVGGSLKHLALLDNFCWCSSNHPDRLGQLKQAVKGCYDYAVAYGTPFISGKDSMFNDFNGFNADGKAIKISVPPTLLISATGVIEDTDKCITLDAKNCGDLVYIIGETKNELGGSEYAVSHNLNGGKVPEVNANSAIKIYQAFEKAINNKLIASSFSLGISGLSMALAKTAIAGKLGMKINLAKLNKDENVNRDDIALYSETQSRILVTITPENKNKFEEMFSEIIISQIGEITEDKFIINGLNDQTIIKTNVNELNKHYRQTFKNF